VIPGTGGARKARVIYFCAPAPELLVLLDIYAKGAKEELTDADRKAIRAL
jgi:hypothetical protein